MIWENGVALAQSQRFTKGDQRSVADIDLDLLRAERLRMGTFDDKRRQHAERTDAFRSVPFRRPAGRGPRSAPPGRAVFRSYPRMRHGWSLPLSVAWPGPILDRAVPNRELG
jgi:hypothetical protein